LRFPPRRTPDERFDRADWLHLAQTATTSARVPPSLRRSLLRRLAAPLSLLALMSGLMAYWLAWQYTQHVVDRSLADLATAISKQIQLAGVDAKREAMEDVVVAVPGRELADFEERHGFAGVLRAFGGYGGPCRGPPCLIGEVGLQDLEGFRAGGELSRHGGTDGLADQGAGQR